ncbi:hypothetical protein TeGR_g2069 [Tetraparma gracilis]|nr:hypothetical protein TeGR_g2069 [Tetraparma gracilis]
MAVLPKSGLGIVKQVLSGDSLFLTNPSPKPDGSTPDALFTLAGVAVPRVGNPRAGTPDEPGAFPARMWLRAKTVGQQCKFDVLRATPDRYFGVLYAKREDGSVENLNEGLVAAGLAQVKADKPAQGGAPDPVRDSLNELLNEALQSAKASCAGVHAGEAQLVRSQTAAGEQFTNDELQAYARTCEGGRLKVLVE